MVGWEMGLGTLEIWLPYLSVVVKRSSPGCEGVTKCGRVIVDGQGKGGGVDTACMFVLRERDLVT